MRARNRFTDIVPSFFLIPRDPMPAHWTLRFIAVVALLFGLYAAKAVPHATVSIHHLYSHSLTFVAPVG